MRPDMQKVIVERPRWGSGRPSAKLGQRVDLQTVDDDFDSGPKRVSSARGGRLNTRSPWGGKWLNENLQPLERYIRSQVGRPWNKVYSEICERIDTRRAIGQHVLDHLEDIIYLDCCLDGRRVMGRSRWRVRRWWRDFTSIREQELSGR